MQPLRQKADICLILEGTYPYVTGGVAGWAHALIESQSHLSFYLCTIVPKEGELELKYRLPSNVIGLTTIRLNDLPKGSDITGSLAERVHETLKAPLTTLTTETPLALNELKRIMDVLSGTNASLGTELLLDHERAWEQLVALYETNFPDHSFLDYFWSYRSIIGGMYSILLAPLPQADVYHALSTGYAGLMAARAKVETGKPAMVTEHGIYLNERRIEVITADWLETTASKALTIDQPRRDLRDMWIDSIKNFSRLCYQASDSIVTLYAGNQKVQLEDGADPAKMAIIPNGVNIDHFTSLTRVRQATPTIGLIGRVVPIKDVKTFIRAVSLLRQTLPDLKAYIVGPTDEDREYYAECLTLVELMGLQATVSFTGQATVEDYLPMLDVIVLTSISEAQPLVALEAGAAGIPLVATDVGACREIIEGADNDDRKLGLGGIITPLASPASTAEAVYSLLSDRERYDACSAAIAERVRYHYNETNQQQAYRTLYAQHLKRA